MEKFWVRPVFMIAASFLFFAGCSSSEMKMIENHREPEFFNQLMNADQDAPVAAQKIQEIKLLQTSEQYPLRLVLFKNGQFYYDIDELGTGYGDWVYQDGGLRMTAKRKFFDVNFYVSAASATGKDMIVKFYDRKGLNTYSVNFRDPIRMQQEGQTPEKLREFKPSDKDL
ncbi:MAG: hypothetical protein ACK5Y2_00350 [Bdellovibrionales bacterium]